MDKLNVELIYSPNQCALKEGDKGYIHAYVNGADNVPYAVVVADHVIEMIPISALKPQYECVDHETEVTNTKN